MNFKLLETFEVVFNTFKRFTEKYGTLIGLKSNLILTFGPIIMIIILSSMDSSYDDTRSSPLQEPPLSRWSLQITITLTEGALLIFFLQSGFEKLLVWPGIEPTTTTLDLISQSGAFDLSATNILTKFVHIKKYNSYSLKT